MQKIEFIKRETLHGSTPSNPTIEKKTLTYATANVIYVSMFLWWAIWRRLYMFLLFRLCSHSTCIPHA